ncbi:hypothetical protein ACFS5L_01020 [Streptomyces phyllanthi]|uniref:hypothetical protein n=1 Tax=Streptomyces phyllanthi TaxID=1803180 RepID=UPI0031E7DF98
MGIGKLRRRTATIVGVLVTALLRRPPVYAPDASTPRIPADATPLARRLFRSPRDPARAAGQSATTVSRTVARS